MTDALTLAVAGLSLTAYIGGIYIAIVKGRLDQTTLTAREGAQP